MNTVITIGRQLGSNGKLIGKELAKRLDFAFHDKNAITLAAKQRGLDENIFENIHEKPTTSLLYSLVMGVQSNKGLYYNYSDFLNGENVFRMQSDLIKSIASEGPCIFVGRCADYILRQNPRLIKIFLYASKEVRTKTLMERDNVTEKEALSAINKADKRRANYYNFYTGNTWGDISNYDLCLDTSVLGFEKTVDLIEAFVKEREKLFK